jgi:glycosyltransferase involved in cell wall biosynthesis
MDSLLHYCSLQPSRGLSRIIQRPIENRIAYVVSHGVSFSSNGYAIRTHGVAKALMEHGFDVLCFTRPGRPWDLGPDVAARAVEQDFIDGVRYLHSRWPDGQRPATEIEVFNTCLSLYKKLFRTFRPSAVIAASNWEVALPAYFAAAQLGLPFFYEVRGFWEITRMSRFPGWENTEEFAAHVARESFVASHADRVFTLNQKMAAELVKRGVVNDRIAVVPNGIDKLPKLKAANPEQKRQLGIAPEDKVVAYIGSITSYEGLDDLLTVCMQIAREGRPLKLMLVGASHPLGIKDVTDEANLTKELLKLAASGNAESMLIFTGRVHHEQVASYYALADVVAIPRKALPVCELVTPIKGIEAASFGKAVLVSDVAALKEMFGGHENGMTFCKGNLKSLKATLLQLLDDDALREKLGNAARQWAGEKGLWYESVKPIAAQVTAAAKEWQQATVARYRRQGGMAEAMPAIARQLAPASVEIAPEAVQPAQQKLEAAGPVKTTAELQIASFLKAYRESGFPHVLETIETMSNGKAKHFKAALYLRAAKALNGVGTKQEEFALAESAIETDRSEATLLGYCWVARRLNQASRLQEVTNELEDFYGVDITADQKTMLSRLRETSKDLLTVLDELPPRHVEAITPVANRICYVLHNTLPYSSGGYATRSHGVAGGLKDAGWDVIVLSRPGFPLDIKEGMTVANTPVRDTIDGIDYVRTLKPRRKGEGLTARAYFLAAADALEAQLRTHRPALVIAASNHVTGLPAMIAARRLGIPFIYEVRGLWEITRLSRDNAFAETDSFHIIKTLESAVAQSADHVFTLTEPMREELINRGVDAARIGLLPNSCDPARFMPAVRDAQLARQLGVPANVPVIGYIGTFVDYEGLEDLAAACGLLKQAGIEFRLLMVGNENASGQERGPITAEILRTAQEQGFADWLILPGRVPHEEVQNYYSLIDIAPFPRKPWPVCEMVSPMKPLEALAMHKAVIVSSVRALVEMVGHEKTGLVFEKGNVESLAAALRRLIAEPELRRQLGDAGREWVERERTWRQVGTTANEVIGRVLKDVEAGRDQAAAVESAAAQ